MPFHRTIFAAFAAVALTAAVPQMAGPMERDLVPEDAVWVVHADLTALRDSTSGQWMLDKLGELPAGAKLQQISDVVGVDLKQDLLDATLFGKAMTPESTAMTATVAGGTGNLEGLLLAAPQYQSRDADGRTIHSFLTEGDGGKGTRLHVYIQPGSADQPGRVVAAHDDGLLEELIDRLDQPSSRRPTRDGALILLARVSELDTQGIRHAPEHSAVLRMIENLRFTLGETDGQISAVAEAAVTDPQRAEQVRQLVQGLLAMVQLTEHTKPEQQLIAALARETKAQRTGSTVAAVLEMDAGEFTQHLERALAAKLERSGNAAGKREMLDLGN